MYYFWLRPRRFEGVTREAAVGTYPSGSGVFSLDLSIDLFPRSSLSRDVRFRKEVARNGETEKTGRSGEITNTAARKQTGNETEYVGVARVSGFLESQSMDSGN